MRQPTPQQEMIALRDHIARILDAGCPETTRLTARAWTLVHEALAAATRPAETAPVATPAAVNAPSAARVRAPRVKRAA